MSLKSSYGLLALVVLAISIPNQTEGSIFFNWRSQSNQETNANVVPVITTTTTSPVTSWFGSWWRTSSTLTNAPPPPPTSDDSEIIQAQTSPAPPRHKKHRRQRKTPAPVTVEKEDEVMAAIKSANYNAGISVPVKMIKLRQSPEEAKRLIKIIQEYALADAAGETTELHIKTNQPALRILTIELAKIYQLEYCQLGNRTVALQKPANHVCPEKVDEDLQAILQDTIQQLMPKQNRQVEQTADRLTSLSGPPNVPFRGTKDQQREYMRLFGSNKPRKVPPTHTGRQFRAVVENKKPLARSNNGRLTDRKMSRGNQRSRAVHEASWGADNMPDDAADEDHFKKDDEYFEYLNLQDQDQYNHAGGVHDHEGFYDYDRWEDIDARYHSNNISSDSGDDDNVDDVEDEREDDPQYRYTKLSDETFPLV